MNRHIEAPGFSVYLGSGLYIGGVHHPETLEKNHVPVAGDRDLGAFTIDRARDAAIYARDAAIRVCHFARRSGLPAWLVQATPA